MKFRESQGRSLIEEKNTNYIVKRTTAHVEVLDPTGRLARVDPSQITDIADYSFGLGKSSRIPGDNMRRITEQIRETLKVDRDELGEYRRLVSGAMKQAGLELDSDSGKGATKERGKKAISFADDEVNDEEGQSVRRKDMSSLEGLASPAGAMPGIDPSATAINFAGNVLEKSSLLKIAVEEDGEVVDPTAGISSAKKPKYPPAQLSQFERDSLEKAKDRHRARIELGTEQVAGGRLFKGQAFVSKPEELVFKDFEVGKKYRKGFLLTNVSYTFNSFKLLDLDDDVIDFFVITYEKPGRMSAGVSCSLEIAFTPQLNKDILTAVRLHTETGPVEIPLKCLIKRCAPRILNPVIDFGRVIVGQKLTSALKIKNSQAIDTEFEVVPLRDEDPATVQDESGQAETEVTAEAAEEYVEDVVEPRATAALNEAELTYRVQRVMSQVFRRMKHENPFPLSSIVDAGAVSGYGATSFDLVCAPLTVGPIERQFRLKFKEVDDGALSVDDIGQLVKKEQFVTATVVGEEVPIYLAEETIDLKCTLFDRIFRRKVVLKNRAKQAYRVSIKVGAVFAKYVEVNPTMLFVQAKSSQSVNVKFTPSADMLSKISYFSCPYENFTDAALMLLPIEIQVVGQELPVYFQVRASVCPSTVQLSSSSLDFGKVYVGQQSSKTITVRNVSMLPQKVAFVRLKKEFSVKPNDGFAVLLPDESMDFEVLFSPISAVDYDVDVTLLTSLNDTYTLKVVAEGVEAPLELSPAVLRLRTTPPGERVVESVVVTNRSAHSQCFQVMAPDARFSWIKVSPAVVQLAAGASSRLEIEYCPPVDAAALDPNEWYASTLAAASSSDGEQSSSSPFDDFQSDSGWVIGKGLFGEMQWYKAPAPRIADGLGEGDVGREKEGDIDEGQSLSSRADDSLVSGRLLDSQQQESESGICDLAPEEWGVVGKWSIPILLKPKRKSSSAHPPSADNAASTARTNLGSTARTGGGVTPLFLSLQTATTLPQIDADFKSLDFGQISVGTRIVRSFKLFNRGFQPLRLRSVGFSAVGPFTLVRPIKEIAPREACNVIVECLPQAPGLIVEVLEISAVEADAAAMGHRVRVTLRVQGLKPSISLEKLAPPPPTWSSSCGLLDFGHCLVLDNQIVKRFTIVNKSTFSIDARIIRVASGAGLSPGQQAALVERTAAGLPVFSFRPERLQIAQGSSAEVEMTFRPDRGRFHPFREDLDIFIGKTDEVYRVGVIGRAWSRQLLVLPGDPRDEAFANVAYQGVSAVEDGLATHSSAVVRAAAKDARKICDVNFPEPPSIVLRYPDPFDPIANPSSFVEVGSATATAAAGKGNFYLTS